MLASLSTNSASGRESKFKQVKLEANQQTSQSPKLANSEVISATKVGGFGLNRRTIAK